MNTLTLVPIISFIFAVLASFGIVLPPTFSAPAVVAAVMLITTAATGIIRFNKGDNDLGLKDWWQSRIIVANIIGALFAILALFGIAAGFEVGGAVDGVMMLIALISMVLGRKPQAAVF